MGLQVSLGEQEIIKQLRVYQKVWVVFKRFGFIKYFGLYQKV